MLPSGDRAMRLIAITSGSAAFAELRVTLDRNDLPTDDLEEVGSTFFVGENGSMGGLWLSGSDALLRSVVIRSEQRGRGDGKRLVEALSREAATLGARDVWLLTTNSVGFFASCGFQEVDRVSAPETIRATRQFAGICPSSATLMHKALC